MESAYFVVCVDSFAVRTKLSTGNESSLGLAGCAWRVVLFSFSLFWCLALASPLTPLTALPLSPSSCVLSSPFPLPLISHLTSRTKNEVCLPPLSPSPPTQTCAVCRGAVAAAGRGRRRRAGGGSWCGAGACENQLVMVRNARETEYKITKLQPRTVHTASSKEVSTSIMKVKEMKISGKSKKQKRK